MRELTVEETNKLKEERDKELWKMQVLCTGKGWQQGSKTPCDKGFEITELDILRRVHNYMGRCETTYYGFVCPNCGCFTEIESEDTSKPKIPFNIRTGAKKYEA